MNEPRPATYSLKLDFASLLGRARSILRGPLPSDLDGLVATWRRCESPSDRARVASAIASLPDEDPRIRGVLVDLLVTDPIVAARLLTKRVERSAVSELSQTFDRLLVAPIADCDICAAEQLTALEYALEKLGGTLTRDQRDGLERVRVRAARQWSQSGAPAAPASPVSVPRGPGRNAPCPCGSGKKFKKCCLPVAERRN